MAVATAPGSSELNKMINRDWAMQVKPKGAEPTEYMFVRGLDSIDVQIETQAVDSSDIDSRGWGSQTKTSRTMTVAIAGKFSTVDGGVLEPSQKLIRETGMALGADGELDVRVWRTDGTDEAWEAVVTNMFQTAGGDANALRAYTSNMQSVGAPAAIQPVEEGGETAASIDVE